MNMPGALALLVAVVASVCGPSVAFPDGAPIEACILGNKPNHYGTEPKSPRESKVDFYATSNFYEPNTEIYVHIEGPSFKGFFVQARDVKTKDWIGSFEETDDLRSYPECASVTHKVPNPKNEAVLRWRAPRKGQGEVFFTGTVLKNYGLYWSDMVAKVIRRRG